MIYPKELTPELREVLGMPMWETGTLARAFRAAGHDIQPKAEAEQAFVLHWLTLLVLEHGSGWRSAAAGVVEAMAAAAGKPIKKTPTEQPST